jgi:flagellar M-ring protein FliF
VHEKRVRTSGIVKRLTVAVAVDGMPGPDPHVMVPRERPALDKIAALVRGAVGADERRGDVVTVESVPFLDTETHAEPPPPPGFKVPPQLTKYVKYWPYAAGGFAFLVLLALIRRSLVRRRRAKKLAAEAAVAEAARLAEAEATKVAQLAADDPTLKLPEPVSPVEQRAEAIRRAKDDPATAALVVRRWLGTTAAET